MLTGVRYQQKTTHILDHGKIGQNTNRWLSCKIKVMIKAVEQTIVAEEASDKEFAIYIWQVLPQLYKGQTTKMNRAFDEYFDYDWSSQMDRANALARLVEINRTRDKEKRIKLFVD